ncbi:DsbA family oxidoreductase [Deinococcus sonorensis]|uniref:DsbA family oxidoreductase n=2 Tax=Deinococcus sonorensis TaxID=309891 RepID=A0AAU7U917_9DEIO
MTASAPLTPLTAPRLQVDIWSDIACPWCYIGKRRFEAALQQFPYLDQVEVVWHSFELDPQAPLQPAGSMRDLLAGKYGRSPEQAQQMLNQMTETAAADGLTYHFDRLQPTNTFQAHQLVHLAAQHGLQDAMKERLFRAYLTEGAHLGELDTLVRLAAEVGLDAAEARTALEQQTHAAAVRQDEAQAQAYGIQGVPFFVLGGKYGVSGAQPPEVLAGALQQLWQEQLASSTPIQLLAPDAASCQDGACDVPQKGQGD